MSSDHLIEENQIGHPPASTRLPLPLLLWLIVLGLTLLFIPLFYLAVSVEGEIERLTTEVVPLEATLTAVRGPSSSDGDDRFLLAETEAQIAQFTAVSPTLAAANINWPAVMNVVNSYDPSQLAITALEQQGRQLILTGRSTDDAVVIAYGQGLEASGLFSTVLVQSIVQINEPFLSPTPFATATAVSTTATAVNATTQSTPTVTKGTPTTTPTRYPTWTPSPDLRDEYEGDDQHAKPIFLGAAQTHNFYPTFDVDNVSFLAKAGRTYRITTKNLAPGVDTFLTVTMRDMVLTNDDAELGTLVSSVTVLAPPDDDVMVWVRITNRGAYGDKMTYQVLVEEIVPTATPTAVLVTPSATPSPTRTPTATATSTATPDLRDAYEPDDPNPAQIWLNQPPQLHNFFPNNDVDHLQFQVKGERTYEFLTGSLAPGVDTEMTVTLDMETWQNDDYDLPGTNNLASAVCFTAPIEQNDAQAQITIWNKVPQFAPELSYTVVVSEVNALQVSAGSINFGTVMTDVVTLPEQVVSLSAAAPLTWTAVSDVSWITLSKNTGTTPETLTITANPSSLEPGEQTGNIVFAWSNACQKAVPVTMTIVPTAAAHLPYSPLDINKRFIHVGKRTLFQNPAAFEFVMILEVGNE